MSVHQLTSTPSDPDQPRRQTGASTAGDSNAQDHAVHGQKEISKPGRGLSAYMFWADDNRQRVRAEHPNVDFGQVGALLGEAWKNLDAAGKAKYEELARKDKVRYEEEMARYKASTSGSPVVIRRKLPANYSLLPSTLVATAPHLGKQTSLQTPSQTPGVSSVVLSASSPQHGTTTPSSSASVQPIDAPELTTISALGQDEIDHAMGRCLNVLTDAVTLHHKRPFSALLLAPDNSTVLLTHHSISHIQHAESELARLASLQYSLEYLRKCTLVSTWEPCAMCAGTIYWSGIGRVLYAASEMKLRELTGAGNAENLTMDLPCRTILNAGQRPVEVVGPVSGWEGTVVDHCKPWWANHQASQTQPGSASVNTNGKHTRSTSNVVVVVPEDSLLGSIGEDGEYQADLKVDWMT